MTTFNGLTIYGGTVNAQGNCGGADIGGGDDGDSGYIEITGGEIYAESELAVTLHDYVREPELVQGTMAMKTQ